MDGTDGVDNSRPELAAFIAAFKTLSVNDRAKALEHINQQDGETSKVYETEKSSTTSAATVSEAHSCHICKQLVVREWPDGPPRPIIVPSSGFLGPPQDREDGGAEDTPSPRPENLILAKDTLRQGLAQKCVLVEWIFTILARGLQNLKSDLAKRVNGPSQMTMIQDVADDLQYISAEGLTVECETWSAEGRATLRITYDAEPYLVDKLWDMAHDLREGWLYADFGRKYDGTEAGRFRMSAIADDAASAGNYNVSVHQKTELDKSSRSARRFLEACQDGHEKCSRSTTTLPTRVIDVGTKFPIQSVRLHWSNENESGRYAALSYCWGGSQPLTTTFATAQDNTDGIVFSYLPRTLQDAIRVTFELGLRYIWIDSLCIVQDDPEDLNREIANMTNIYRGAFVTISAASSTSVHHGFLSTRKPRRTRLALPFQSPDKDGSTVYLEHDRRAYDPEDDPINLRAWTLQEHILPRRMLIFGTRELWWTCESAVTFDTVSSTQVNEYVPPVQRKSGGDRFSISYWRSIVRDYTRRFLTFPNDKLSAIAGVADLYAQFFNSRYLAGLWEFALLPELMWCSTRSDITRPLARRAPSWSWASVDGEVHHNWSPLGIGQDAPSIIECNIHPLSDSSPFGPVDTNRCILRIRGRLIKAYWQLDRRYISTVVRYRTTINAEGKTEEVDVYGGGGRTHADAVESDSLTEVWMLPITMDPIRGLLLAHVEGESYRRVGLVSRLWSESFTPEDQALRTISIV